MENLRLSITSDYRASKENLLKDNPLKKALYIYRQYFEKKPCSYALLKILFGFLLFALPFSVSILRFSNALFTHSDTTIPIVVIPPIVSCAVLILYTFLPY